LNNSRSQKPAQLQAWVRWSITLAWAILIFDLSTSAFGGALSAWLLREMLSLAHLSISDTTFAMLHFLLRKLAHCTEYAVFSLLLYHCILNSNRTEWRARAAAWSVLIAGLYSLTDEFHQLFVPGRGASLMDCGIDTTGAVIGMLVILVWTRFIQTGFPATAVQEPDYVISK
jgi:VanZ family protein